jgi:hypothetical protein
MHINPEKFREKGALAFKMGIDNNPESGDARMYWEQGWKRAERGWNDLLKKYGGALGMRSNIFTGELLRGMK